LRGGGNRQSNAHCPGWTEVRKLAHMGWTGLLGIDRRNHQIWRDTPSLMVEIGRTARKDEAGVVTFVIAERGKRVAGLEAES